MIELLSRPARGSRSRAVKKADSSRVGSAWEATSQTSQTVQGVPEPVPTPSKKELVRQWFRDHPEDADKPGRELEKIAPMGVKITYKTWNDVKKELKYAPKAHD